VRPVLLTFLNTGFYGKRKIAAMIILGKKKDPVSTSDGDETNQPLTGRLSNVSLLDSY
jgi:hypothetical protein